ncbi:CHC2 zinc finger domain-containing protein [Paludisphaera sp.]|uniref:CHC2 zinc finger domain-containing protein n=1 Tax=Paludisphaera sp. TaxID=2017432 RepID=UPI00301BAF9B
MPSPFVVRAPRRRLEWDAIKDQVDVATVVEALLGEPPGRGGSRGLWWSCPFHADANPSFRVDPERGRWRCFGCGERGDAAGLVMRLESLTFPEAVRRVADLCGLSPYSWADRAPIRPTPRPAPAKAPGKPVAGPSGLSSSDASALVAEAAERLWTRQGEWALSYLHGRALDDGTIRDAHLGWVDRAIIPKRDGSGSYALSGVCIPWFDRGRLAMAKVRRLDGREPKYLEIFRDGPTVYPSPDAIRPALPLVAVEGEFDALTLAQLIGDLARVVTVGSASTRVDADIRRAIRSAPALYAAHDADDAGDRAAASWPSRAVRVRPPAPAKDWSDAHRLGYSVVRNHWVGIIKPPGPSWETLEAQRWGDDGPEDLGCVADDPTLGWEPEPCA